MKIAPRTLEALEDIKNLTETELEAIRQILYRANAEISNTPDSEAIKDGLNALVAITFISDGLYVRRFSSRRESCQNTSQIKKK